MRRTHLRTVSGVGPSFSATDEIASYCEPQSRWASKTIRTARSRISSGYFPRAWLLCHGSILSRARAFASHLRDASPILHGYIHAVASTDEFTDERHTSEVGNGDRC